MRVRLNADDLEAARIVATAAGRRSNKPNLHTLHAVMFDQGWCWATTSYALLLHRIESDASGWCEPGALDSGNRVTLRPFADHYPHHDLAKMLDLVTPGPYRVSGDLHATIKAWKGEDPVVVFPIGELFNPKIGQLVSRCMQGHVNLAWGLRNKPIVAWTDDGEMVGAWMPVRAVGTARTRDLVGRSPQ